MKSDDQLQWFTETTYVDTDTGEIIPQKIAKRDYIILNTQTQYDRFITTGVVKRTVICRRNGQLKIDFTGMGT